MRKVITDQAIRFTRRLQRELAASGGQRDAWLGKRRHPRVTGRVELDMMVAGELAHVQCLDASDSGLVVLCKRSLPREAFNAGVLVRFPPSDDEGWVRARAQHVTETLSGFKIGLEYLH